MRKPSCSSKNRRSSGSIQPIPTSSACRWSLTSNRKQCSEIPAGSLLIRQLQKKYFANDDPIGKEIILLKRWNGFSVHRCGCDEGLPHQFSLSSRVHRKQPGIESILGRRPMKNASTRLMIHSLIHLIKVPDASNLPQPHRRPQSNCPQAH